MRIIEDYIDQEKLTIDQGGDIAFEEKIELDLTNTDSTNKVVNMIESLANDNSEDEDVDDDVHEAYEETDGEYIPDDDDDELAYIDDADLEKHGLKLSYTNSRG